MKFSFEAKIYKVGINPCVDIPLPISNKMIASKGYIPVKGKINGFSFQQTLVAVKNAPYRLYVNGPMLKGGNTKPGETAKFIIEQDLMPAAVPMLDGFKKELDDNGLFPAFKKLTPYRQKEILKYLNYLKTEDAIKRNIDKVISQLKKRNTGLL